MRAACRLAAFTAALPLLVICLPALAQGEPGNAAYTPEQIRSISAEAFLEHMLPPEPGYGQFAAMNALAQKAKESEPAARAAILGLVTRAMHDTTRDVNLRYQCCYVLSGCGDVSSVPELVKVLQHDTSSIMRGVAAEALANFWAEQKSEAAHEALLQDARTEKDPSVQEVLTRRLGAEVKPLLPEPSAPSMLSPGPPLPPSPPAVEELAPSGPPEPPAPPKRPVDTPLPWPFPGGVPEQTIFNNYQQPTDDYLHCGLDFLHPAGTPVTAVASGYVSLIWSNYSELRTHDFFIVTPEEGGDVGWCYTHMDASTFTFTEGDYIRQGQELGKLVKFSVGNNPGIDHLHLHYVRFSREGQQVKLHSLLDPLYFFDWKDTEAPVFQRLRFVSEGTKVLFEPDADGVVTVSGRVDILAAIADTSFPGQFCNFGVPVVMLSISDGRHTEQKLVVDHRGDVGDEKRTKPLYLTFREKQTYLDANALMCYQMLRVTKTDGDGLIQYRDSHECWDTAGRTESGRRLWPNGTYHVNVYAWDLAGNGAVTGAVVKVKNR